MCSDSVSDVHSTVWRWYDAVWLSHRVIFLSTNEKTCARDLLQSHSISHRSSLKKIAYLLNMWVAPQRNLKCMPQQSNADLLSYDCQHIVEPSSITHSKSLRRRNSRCLEDGNIPFEDIWKWIMQFVSWTGISSRKFSIQPISVILQSQLKLSR